MNYLDTRDLAEKREELKQQILDSFLETFPQYEDMTSSYEDIRLGMEEEIEEWENDWSEEIEEIEEINDIEDQIGSEFQYGCTLVAEQDFEDYAQELCKDYDYIAKDFPSWIEIDWKATADNIAMDYITVEYKGTTYLGRG